MSVDTLYIVAPETIEHTLESIVTPDGIHFQRHPPREREGIDSRRIFYGHPFSARDRAWLKERLSQYKGVVFSDHIPTDWRYPITDLVSLMEIEDDPPGDLATVVRIITSRLIEYVRASPRELYNIRPRQFEEIIAEILASYGWDVELTPPTKDGGYDLFAISRDISGVKTSWIVECKKYKPENKVGVEVVRSLFGVKHDLRVANAMIATTSHFTRGVKDFKESHYDLDLRDYEGILDWINDYRPNPSGRLLVRQNRVLISED